MPESPALRISVTHAEGGRVLKIAAASKPTPTTSGFRPVPEGIPHLDTVWEGSLDEAEVRAFLEQVRKTLDEIHKNAGAKVDLAPDVLRVAVDKLVDLSWAAVYALVKGDLKAVFDATAPLTAAVKDPREPPRIVEISTPYDFAFPFELLPWVDLGPTDNSDRMICSLLGMSAITARHPNDGEAAAEGGRLNQTPRLQVSLLCNDTLKAALKEVDYLIRKDSVVETYGPWPQNQNLAKYAAIDHILDSKNGLFDAQRDEWVDLLHLACHANTTGMVNDHYLNVGGGDYGRIRLGDLKKRRAQTQSEPRLPRPLVFLNACASSEVQAGDRATFTKFFLDNKFLGVLGTLCDISDPVASHFAIVFYEHLLRGLPVGMAMHASRRHLLEVHHNPLGLLYSYYGNPDLRVEPGHYGALKPACERQTADERGL